MTPTEAAPLTELAPAKLNLCLHVTGQRADGYHLLDSLVAFTEVGDRVTVTPADRLSLSIEGPFAAGLSSESENLVLRAARLLDPQRGAHIHLHKALPVAAGIGGGSADAAATLRALSRLWERPLPEAAQTLALGADVPACLTPGLFRMRGIGQELARLQDPSPLPLLLVNPGVAVSTPGIFGALAPKTNAQMDDAMPASSDTAAWVAWLARQRNDLTAPAIAEEPVIGRVLEALSVLPGVRLARMSGSGATCFALFAETARRDAAAESLHRAHPGWWVMATSLRSA
uniref:4-(cytidine 5'-diphospho)-2-C-methyl-D-erythritol kinase n=1 Tax=Salibaculum sp. TaxID=2855480 RepID=UPI00386F7207